MKKLFAIAVVIMALGAVSAAQNPVTVDNPYQLNTYDNRNNTAGADGLLRIVNDGAIGSPLSAGHGTICANLFVFDAGQEMIECCSCPITGNGLREISILKDLTANPLTGFPAPNSGVIKQLATNGVTGACDPTAVATATLVPGLLSWASHIEQPVSGTFVAQSDPSLPGTLSANELAFLGQSCSFVQFLGSGKGVCTCGSGDGFDH